jgi:hypothetical protein
LKAAFSSNPSTTLPALLAHASTFGSSEKRSEELNKRIEKKAVSALQLRVLKENEKSRSVIA